MSPGTLHLHRVRARRRGQQLARLEREDGRVRRHAARHADRARRRPRPRTRSRSCSGPRRPTPAEPGIVRYDVYRGATLAGSTAVASFTDAALTQSGTNVYTITAVDGAGNVGPASASVTVVYDVTAPTIPGSLTATTPTSLAARAHVGRVDRRAERRRPLRRVPRQHEDQQLARRRASAYTDTSPVTGSQTYSVKAIDAAGNTTAGVHGQDRRVRPDTRRPRRRSRRPRRPASIPALTWTAVDRHRRLGPRRLPRLPRRDADRHDHVDVVHGLRLGRRAGHLRLHVVAFDGAGNTTSSVVTHRDRRHVRTDDADVGHGAHADGAPPVISWAASSDGSGPSSSGIVRYDVYRGAVLAGSSTTNTYTDTGATANSSLAYTVVAVDAAGNRSAASAAANVVYDTSPPPLPTNVGGTTPTATAPVVTWTSGGADNLSGLAYYAVYRGATLVGTTTSLVVHGQRARDARARSRTPSRPSTSPATRAPSSSIRTIVFDPIAPGQPGKPTIASPTDDPVAHAGPPRPTRAARTSRTTTSTGRPPGARRRSPDRATARRSAIRR